MADYRLLALEMANDDAMQWRHEAMALRIVAVEAMHLLADYHKQIQRGDRLRQHLRDEYQQFRALTMLGEPPTPEPTNSVSQSLRERSAVPVLRRPR